MCLFSYNAGKWGLITSFHSRLLDVSTDQEGCRAQVWTGSLNKWSSLLENTFVGCHVWLCLCFHVCLSVKKKKKHTFKIIFIQSVHKYKATCTSLTIQNKSDNHPNVKTSFYPHEHPLSQLTSYNSFSFTCIFLFVFLLNTFPRYLHCNKTKGNSSWNVKVTLWQSPGRRSLCVSEVTIDKYEQELHLKVVWT